MSRAIVVLTNTNAAPTYLKIANELIYLLFEPSADDKFARTLFSELQIGHLDESVLSEDLKQYLTPGRLREYSSSLAPLGPVEAFSLARADSSDGLVTKEYDVIAGGKKLRMHLLLLPTSKVEDVTVSSAQ